jgi:gentisate 1,2-dioxygenase
MRYVNPLTGGAVMPTIDCRALKLAARQETRPLRSTSSAICVVVAGEGHTTVGDETIRWTRNDVFTLPHWQWASHVATSGDAYLVVLDNQELLQRLGLLVTETQH